RIHHPGPPPECRRAGSDPDSARRTSVVASDATLPRTLRPVGLAQRRWPAQLCRRESQISGARAPRSSGGLSIVWLSRLAMPAPRRLHWLDPASAPTPSAATDQQHPFPHPALGESAASVQPYLEPGHPAPEL